MSLKEKIAVMQAAEDGAVIECLDTNSPLDGYQITKPQWNWNIFKYRVKPDAPREFWINKHPEQEYICAYKTEAGAIKGCGPTGETIHVIEILEEES